MHPEAGLHQRLPGTEEGLTDAVAVIGVKQVQGGVGVRLVIAVEDGVNANVQPSSAGILFVLELPVVGGYAAAGVGLQPDSQRQVDVTAGDVGGVTGVLRFQGGGTRFGAVGVETVRGRVIAIGNARGIVRRR